MSKSTFNLEKRVSELDRLTTSRIFDQFIGSLQASEIKINEHLHNINTSYREKDKIKSSEEIAKFILEKIPDTGYLNQAGLGKVILDVVSNYDSIHGPEKKRVVHLRDKSTGNYYQIYQTTHAMMVPIIPLIVNETFPQFDMGKDRIFARNILPGLYHDIPEDSQKKGLSNPRKKIIEISDFVGPLFFSDKNSEEEEIEIEYIKKVLCNVTHERKQSYEDYILGLFFERNFFIPKLYPEDIFLGNLYLKLADATHNGTNQGIVRKLTQQDDTLYGYLGLSNERRMKGNLKSFTLLNPTTQFFDLLSQEGEVDSRYSPLFDLFFILHAVTNYNLNKLRRGTRRIYRREKPILTILNKLNKAMTTYSDTPSILEITKIEHDIQYYLDNEIDPTIYDGSLDSITKRVERMGEPLYSNITEAYHLVKLYVHTLALKHVLGQTFKNPSKGLNYVNGFANLPEEIF